MSQQDVELVQRAMEAWNRENIAELIPLSDPEVEFVSIFAGMEGRTYRGYDGLRQYFADMKDVWAEFHRDIGVAFEGRWKRFDEAVTILRALLGRAPGPESTRYYPLPAVELAPRFLREGGIPLWIGSWGSAAGLRRVARLADGWLASAYNTTPERFASGRELLAGELPQHGRRADGFPNALVTMWTWVTEDPEELRDQVCVGSAERCGELLSHYARAGCQRVYLWPLGDEPRQVELVAAQVVPRIER